MKRYLLLIVCLFAIKANAQVLLNNMEQWRLVPVGSPSVTLDVVNGWRCPDSIAHEFGFLISNPKRQLFKSSDKVSGDYAARIVSEIQGSFGSSAGILTSAVIKLDLVNQTYTLSGGTPIYGRVNFINAWIKYNPQGGDTASVSVSVIKTGAGAGGNDSVLGTGVYRVSTQIPYTLVDVPITYTNTTTLPDALQIVFSSSGRRATVGSELLIDDVSYSIFPASVANNNGSKQVLVYPNPASDKLYINSSDAIHKITLYSMDGRQLMSEYFQGNTSLDVASLPQGTYCYALADDNGTIIQRQTITIAR